MTGKRLFTALSLLVFMFLVAFAASAEEQPTEVQSGTCGTNATWSYDAASTTLTISGTGNMEDYSVSSPWHQASYRYDISRVIIEEGITSVGARAFQDLDGLQQLQLPSSLTRIGEKAFYICDNLKSIQLPSKLEYIGCDAFSCCGFETLKLPNSVTECGSSAFSECNNLKEATLSNQISKISFDMFSSCDSLTSVTIPAGIKEVEYGAFGYCPKLRTVTFLGDVPSFHSRAFVGTTTLVRYPANNPTWTQDKMQDYGGSITWLSSGDAPITGTFGRWNLNWTLQDGTLTISGDGYMDGWSRTAPWYPYRGLIKKVVLAGKLDNIYANAFRDCTELTEIQWSNTIIALHESAFKGCTSLKTVKLPNSVKALGSNVFDGCTSLTTVTLSENLEEIGCEVFTGCTSLKSLTIPATLHEILSGAFRSSVNSLYFKGNFPKTLNNSNADYTGSFAGFKGTIYYPANNTTWSAASIKEQTDIYGSNIKFVASAELNSNNPPASGSSTPSNPSGGSTAPNNPSGGSTVPNNPSTEATTPSNPSSGSDIQDSTDEIVDTPESPTTTDTTPNTTTDPTPTESATPSSEVEPELGNTIWIWITVGIVIITSGIAVTIFLKKRK